MAIVFFPLTRWQPDGTQYGQDLELQKGALPVYNSFRTFRKDARVDSVDLDALEVGFNGAHTHVYQVERVQQRSYPEAIVYGPPNDTDPGWQVFPKDADPPPTTLEALGGDSPDDAKGYVGQYDGAEGMDGLIWWEYEGMDMPSSQAADTHFFRVRYRVEGVEGALPRITLDVWDMVLDSSIRFESIDITGQVNDGNWHTYSFSLTAGQAAGITSYNAVGMKLEIKDVTGETLDVQGIEEPVGDIILTAPVEFSTGDPIPWGETLDAASDDKGVRSENVEYGFPAKFRAKVVSNVTYYPDTDFSLIDRPFVSLRYQLTETGGRNRIRLYSAGDLILTRYEPFSTNDSIAELGWKTYSFQMSEEQCDAVTDWNDLEIEIQGGRPDPSTNVVIDQYEQVMSSEDSNFSGSSAEEAGTEWAMASMRGDFFGTYASESWAWNLTEQSPGFTSRGYTSPPVRTAGNIGEIGSPNPSPGTHLIGGVWDTWNQNDGAPPTAWEAAIVPPLEDYSRIRFNIGCYISVPGDNDPGFRERYLGYQIWQGNNRGGGTLLYSSDRIPRGGITLATAEVTEYSHEKGDGTNVIEQITDWNDLWISFQCLDDGGGGGIAVLQRVTVYLTALGIEADRVFEWDHLELTSAAEVKQGAFSWSEFQTPQEDVGFIGDLEFLLAGTLNKQYLVDQDGFEDITNGLDFTENAAGAWYYASFGKFVFACNFADNLMVLDPTVATPGWAEAVPGGNTTRPKGRFIAAVRNHVVLADINIPDHFPDEVFWSAFEDGTDWDTSPSDYSRLLAHPGQITGLVGGKHGLIFKRRSLSRLTWVGGQYVFRIDDLSGSVGAPYPGGIAAAESATYFWGGGRFYVTTGDGQPMQIGANDISRWMEESAFNISPEPLEDKVPTSLLDEDLRMKAGYCQSSGMVFWLYQRKGEDNYFKRNLIMYNPSEDRWGFGQLDATASVLIPRFNVISDESHFVKGVYLFGQEALAASVGYWARFDGNQTFDISLTTKIFSLSEVGAARINGIKPMFTLEPQDLGWPEITITVETSNDPRFFVNPSSGEKVRSESYTLTRANDYLWYPNRVEGYHFRITVDVPGMQERVVSSMSGLYLDVKETGREGGHW